ncbi:Uncharacterized protein QTN25_005891 [Entamoeba marina]
MCLSLVGAKCLSPVGAKCLSPTRQTTPTFSQTPSYFQQSSLMFSRSPPYMPQSSPYLPNSSPTLASPYLQQSSPTLPPHFSPPKQTEEKKIDKNQYQCDVLIESQRTDGHFIDIDKVYPNLAVLSKKYSNLEIDVLSTIVAITLFRTHFKEKKIQWDLLVKKALRYLENKNISEEIINQMAAEINI